MANKAFLDPLLASKREQEPFSSPLKNSKDLDPLLARIDNARFVLLGEASHGTHEYYTWRAAITKRLIVEKGFNFIAVEGDWPDCYQINRFIKGYNDTKKDIIEILHSFDRWPTWMWANWEIASLANWLKEYNSFQQDEKKIGFYGLDVYSLWDSMNHIIEYLKKQDPQTAAIARRAIDCFDPYEEEGQNYARANYYMSEECTKEVVELLTAIRKKGPLFESDREEVFNAEQNALIAVNAEKYYRSMMSFRDESWNIRDTHMVETLNRLVKFHGDNSKCIVWEHNTHIGDARYTDMKDAGMVNVGQLVREQNNDEDVVLVGFGSYQGTVIAGSEWGAPMKIKRVPPARSGSFEDLVHSKKQENQLFIFNRNNKEEKYSRTILPHRAIGVVYNPENERYGNYVPTRMDMRYDAFIYLDTTKALFPLHLKPDGHKIPETYPFGF